jgi:hypothetical protein
VIRRADVHAIAFALFFPTVLTLVYFKLLADAPMVVVYITYGGLKLVQFGFPLFWYLKIQKRTLRFRLPGGRGVLAGVGSGLLILGGMWLVYEYVLLPAGSMDAATGPIRRKLEGCWKNTTGAGLFSPSCAG